MARDIPASTQADRRDGLFDVLERAGNRYQQAFAVVRELERAVSSRKQRNLEIVLEQLHPAG